MRKWRVAAAEDVAGDDQEVAADRLGDELGGRAPGGAGKGVEGAFGDGQLEASLRAATTMSRLRR